MRILPLAAALLLPLPALAAPAPPQPPPIVQACAASATEQLQQAMVWHAQAIADGQQIAALKAQVAKLTPHPAATTRPKGHNPP